MGYGVWTRNIVEIDLSAVIIFWLISALRFPFNRKTKVEKVIRLTTPASLFFYSGEWGHN
jgi:hypothetical protein